MSNNSKQDRPALPNVRALDALDKAGSLIHFSMESLRTTSSDHPMNKTTALRLCEALTYCRMTLQALVQHVKPDLVLPNLYDQGPNKPGGPQNIPPLPPESN